MRSINGIPVEKQVVREEISNQVKEYLEQGNQIQQIPYGVTTLEESTYFEFNSGWDVVS